MRVLIGLRDVVNKYHRKAGPGNKRKGASIVKLIKKNKAQQKRINLKYKRRTPRLIDKGTVNERVVYGA